MFLIFFSLLNKKNSNLKGTSALLFSCARYNSRANECYRTYAGSYLHAAVMAHSAGLLPAYIIFRCRRVEPPSAECINTRYLHVAKSRLLLRFRVTLNNVIKSHDI